MLYDRHNGNVAVCVYCESRDQVLEADRILESMTPTNKGWGTRVSAEIYEVALDETTG